MEETCRYCGGDEVVPVYTIKNTDRPTRGNKHRRFCTSCERWLPMCSASYFHDHPHKHVLPPDSTLEEKRVLPVDEFHAMGGNIPWRNDISGRSGAVVRIPLNEQEENEEKNPHEECKERNPDEESKSDVVAFVERIQVLNDAVRMLVDNDIVEEAAAYQFLAGKLSELLDSREECAVSTKTP